jgi:hypothetical protein
MKRGHVLIFCLLVGLQGCYAGKSTLITPEGISLSGYKAIELSVQNETGATFPFDIAAYLTEQLVQVLRERGYSVQEPAPVGQSILRLDASIVAYQPGSAVQRWLGTGGKTQATVRAFLFDKASSASLGEILSVKWISEGGLYTIGADRTIFHVVASNIADEIQRRASMR